MVYPREREPANMSQSRFMSGVEAVTNVAVGYGISVGTQMAVLPLWNIHAELSTNLEIAGVFTVVSLVRGYMLRRAFNGLRPLGEVLRGVEG